MTNTRITDVEILERRYPVLVNTSGRGVRFPEAAKVRTKAMD